MIPTQVDYIPTNIVGSYNGVRWILQIRNSLLKLKFEKYFYKIILWVFRFMLRLHLKHAFNYYFTRHHI